MNFRSTTLHLRNTYTAPPEEFVFIDAVETVITEMVTTETIPYEPAEIVPVYPRSKVEYPPEIPKEIEPVDLPLIVKLSPASVTWLRNPLEPVERTMPRPVRKLLARTRRLYRSSARGCLETGGINTVCLKRYGARILAVRSFLTRPKQKAPAITPRGTRLLSRPKVMVSPLRKTVKKGVATHSTPAGIGCTDFDGYSFDLQWEGDVVGNVTLIVRLNGTQIFDTGMTGNNAKSLTLKTDAGIPAPVGIFNGLFSKSLFKNSGNILRLEFTGDVAFIGLNAIQAVDEFGWMKDGAFWSATATSNQLTDVSFVPPVIVPPAIGAYPLNFDFGVSGIC